MKPKAECWLALLLGVAAMLATAKASDDSTGVANELVKSAKHELRENILPFWLKHAPDREGGGFQGQVNEDLSAVKNAPRGALLTCRILWVFSAAHRREPNPEFLKMAHRAFEDLQNRFWDEQYAGLYWTISAKGKPLDSTKQVYGQAFGIYALSEYYRATGEPAALARAIAIYRKLESHARDKIHGGYFEVFERDWRRANLRKNVIGSIAEKSQNTHLHIMEAYTNLLRVWPDAELRRDLRALVELMLTRIYDEKTHHLRLFMDDDWTPKSDRVSYGHDIEAAWLLTEAADVLGDSELIGRTRRIAVEIAETTLKEGVDGDGGVFNEGCSRGVADDRKEWWPQAEAVVGFLNAYQISGDRRFLDAAMKTWKFIETRIIDRTGGEWHRSVSRGGAPDPAPRISLWKCPYHNSRACLEISERLTTAKPEKAL